MSATRVCSRNMHTSWHRGTLKILTIALLSPESSHLGCGQDTNHHLDQHMNQSPNKSSESHHAKLRMDTGILRPLPLNTVVILLMRRARLDTHHLRLHLCHSIAQPPPRNMRLRFKSAKNESENGNEFWLPTNNGSRYMADHLRLRHINLRNRRLGEH
jgi:hypothetical protein